MVWAFNLNPPRGCRIIVKMMTNWSVKLSLCVPKVPDDSSLSPSLPRSLYLALSLSLSLCLSFSLCLSVCLSLALFLSLLCHFPFSFSLLSWDSLSTHTSCMHPPSLSLSLVSLSFFLCLSLSSLSFIFHLSLTLKPLPLKSLALSLSFLRQSQSCQCLTVPLRQTGPAVRDKSRCHIKIPMETIPPSPSDKRSSLSSDNLRQICFSPSPFQFIFQPLFMNSVLQ